MSFSISQLASILHSASSPKEAATLLKLLSVDVTKSFGDGSYLVESANKNFRVLSEKPLSEGAKYWLELANKGRQTPLVTKFLQQPKLFEAMMQTPISFDIKEVHALLSSKKTLQSFKTELLQQLSLAQNKEEFTQISALLLSLMQNTLTLPLQYGHTFGVFQMKKRYNKTSKKSQLDFYASLAKLGPICGTLLQVEDEIVIDLEVAFTTTKLFLEENLKTLQYKTTLHIGQNIPPLYQFHSDAILDINV